MRAMTSAKFSPAALTSTRTWPGPGTGSGRSWTSSTSGPPCLVMTIARMGATLLVVEELGARVFHRRLEDPGLGGLEERAAAEERPVEDPADGHQDDAEQQHPDADRDRHLDAGQRWRVGVDVLRVVDERLDEQRAHHHEAQQRHHADQEEVPRALEQLAAEVDDRGQAGQAVIEGDREA